jgi:hypothetical protein
MNLHIEQHNQHADLQEYRVAPLAENRKTLCFQDGIRDPSLNAVKASINGNGANFTDFDSVKDAYVESSAQKIRPMTQGPDKLPLLLAVGTEAGISHTSMTKYKDPRPLTNARRCWFPNLK